jgi:y4mF family transcriptional regulator
MNKVEHLGQMIRDTRRSQKLTQEQLAATTGVGVRFIRELEQGKKSCHVGKVFGVLAMLGLDIRVGGNDL